MITVGEVHDLTVEQFKLIDAPARRFSEKNIIDLTKCYSKGYKTKPLLDDILAIDGNVRFDPANIAKQLKLQLETYNILIDNGKQTVFAEFPLSIDEDSSFNIVLDVAPIADKTNNIAKRNDIGIETYYIINSVPAVEQFAYYYINEPDDIMRLIIKLSNLIRTEYQLEELRKQLKFESLY